jgi:Tfp pilus assembly protein PilN
VSLADVNLARRPFANSRPVLRVTLALWVVGALLALGNLLLYGRSLAGLEDMKDRIAAAETTMAGERSRVSAAEQRLRGMDLGEQNELAAYLNERIEERTFPWSRLFDHLAEVLPREVRLHTLSPRRVAGPSLRESAARATRTREPDEPEGRVGLAMTGQAQTDQALLELIDNLFGSEWFVDPGLASETRSADDTLRFQLSVAYLPAMTPTVTELELVATVAEEETSPSPAAPTFDVVTGGRAATREEAAAPEATPPDAAGRLETPTGEGTSRPAAPETWTGEAPPRGTTTRPSAPSPRGAEPPAVTDRPATAVPVPLRPEASRVGGGR